MYSFLTKGLTTTAPLWSDVRQGYAWVHRAAHLLTNEEKLEASGVRHRYEGLLQEMEQAQASSESLAAMLSTFCKVTTSYWPGLFHCYDVADLPRTNNELEQYLAPLVIMSGERREENKPLQQWSYVEPFGWLPLLLPACIPSLGESCAQLISRDGMPCAAILNQRHEARRMQHRFRKSPESYLAVLEDKLSKERLPP
jgi:hypothetical protein